MDEIADDSVYMRLVAAQVCDVQSKIDLAIDDTVRLLGHAVRSTASPIPFTPGVVVPTVSRILCDRIVRCFGFPKLSAAHVDDIMNKVVWANLARFMLQTLSQDVVRLTGIAVLNSAAVFGAPSLVLPGLPLLDTPPAARMIVKCACDLILILQCAFQSGNKFVTSEDIRSATIQYKAKRRSEMRGSHESIREVVHEEINKLIPLHLSRQGAQILSDSNKIRIRTTMKEIIRDNAFRKEDSARFQTDSVESSTNRLT
ncbi:putative ras gtpase [Diplodia seriata]|uniref:Putative ras gtpase n=1 Tax=Diplodia seriata TaxID=420778 RepID=A0A0G2DVX2_9PEZI|nr:putative ras gtpase [Diplodia seriata]